MLKAKRILSAMLCFALLVCLFPVDAHASVEYLHSSGQFLYTIDNGEVTITRGLYDETCPREGWPITITIPNEIDGYPVTRIGESAFWSWHAVDTIYLPDTLEEIGRTAFLHCQGLRVVDMPHVKTIGASAFKGCISLEAIRIPSSVETIGPFAYDGCKAVTEISIGEVSGRQPDHVINIEFGSAFYQVGAPEILKLGNIVKKFDPIYMARYNLKELWVANSVAIQDSEEIGVPETVTVYGYTGSTAEQFATENALAFVPLDDDGTLEKPENMNLLSVYPARGSEIDKGGDLELTFNIKPARNVYGGSIYIKDYNTDETVLELDWEDINLRSVYSENTIRISNGLKGLKAGKYYVLVDKGLFTAEKVVNGVLNAFPGITQKEYWTFTVWDAACLELNSATFQYYSTVTKETEEYTFDYTDKWFFADNTVYNHELAQMSIRMAMAAARTTAVSIKDLFNTLQLSYTADSIHFPTPTANSIGYAIGSRDVYYEGEKINLVVVAVRGGGYKAEWGGNFMLGTGEEHQGFAVAADTVVNGVLDYINKMDDRSNLRIWITGYSRAAATSNLAAHRLNKLAKKMSVEGLSEDSVYAYCFECPRGVRTNSAEFRQFDKNIFNIVNPVDLVPLVAPPQWGYDRYGTTLYLPDSSGQYKLYRETVSSMQGEYRNILSFAGVYGDISDYVSHKDGQKGFLWSMTGKLTDYFGNPNVFFAMYQGQLERLAAEAADSDSDVGTLFLRVMTQMADFAEKNPSLISDLATYAWDIGKLHYPELCLAWMDAIDATKLTTDAGTVYVRVNCPVNVTVYDEMRNVVLRIVDDEVVACAYGDAYVDTDGQKMLILPTDMEFTIEIDAADSADVSCQIEEFDIDAGTSARVLNYYDVPMESGDTIKLRAEAQAGDYVLTNQNNEVVKPDSDVSGDAIKHHSLTVAAEGPGSVTGGGMFTEGEFARVTAIPEDDAQFLGWYSEGVLVSEALAYRFRMDCAVELTARFSEAKPFANPFTDVAESDYFYDAVLWAVQNGITSGTSATTFAPADGCTRGQIVTFLWRAMGKPEPVSDKNPFVDVYESDYYYEAVLWAVENRITSGTGGARFSPEDRCTRNQVVTFLWRTMHNPTAGNRSNPFADVYESDYYYEAVLWAVENGITSGTSPTTFAPTDPCTRGQVVTFLYRTLKNK